MCYYYDSQCSNVTEHHTCINLFDYCHAGNTTLNITNYILLTPIKIRINPNLLLFNQLYFSKELIKSFSGCVRGLLWYLSPWRWSCLHIHAQTDRSDQSGSLQYTNLQLLVGTVRSPPGFPGLPVHTCPLHVQSRWPCHGDGQLVAGKPTWFIYKYLVSLVHLYSPAQAVVRDGAPQPLYFYTDLVFWRTSYITQGYIHAYHTCIWPHACLSLPPEEEGEEDICHSLLAAGAVVTWTLSPYASSDHSCKSDLLQDTLTIVSSQLSQGYTYTYILFTLT